MDLSSSPLQLQIVKGYPLLVTLSLVGITLVRSSSSQDDAGRHRTVGGERGTTVGSGREAQGQKAPAAAIRRSTRKLRFSSPCSQAAGG